MLYNRVLFPNMILSLNVLGFLPFSRYLDFCTSQTILLFIHIFIYLSNQSISLNRISGMSVLFLFKIAFQCFGLPLEGMKGLCDGFQSPLSPAPLASHWLNNQEDGPANLKVPKGMVTWVLKQEYHLITWLYALSHPSLFQLLRSY